MEAVGAAASIIAIGQAVQALVQFALYLQSLRGLGGQADALMLELQYFPMYSEELQKAADFLYSIADHANNNASVSSDLNSELISATHREMQHFVEAVEEFQRSCESLRPRTESSTSRFAWFKLILKRNDLQELRGRAQIVRPRFHETISVLMSYQQRKQTRLLLDLMSISCTIRNQTTTIISNQNRSPRLAIEDPRGTVPTVSKTSMPSSGRDPSTGVQNVRRRKKRPGAQTSRETAGTNVTSTAKTHDNDNNSTATAGNRSSANANLGFVRRLQSSPIFSDRVEPSAAARSHSTDFPDYASDDSIIHLQAQLIAECLPGCRCACHVKRTNIDWDAGKLWSVLQGCAFQYSSAPLVYRPACTYTYCKRSRKSTVAVSLKVPVWLCSRMLYLRTSIDGLSSLGSRLSFRCGREVYDFGPGNFWIECNPHYLQSWMIHTRSILYPWDMIDGNQVQNNVFSETTFEFLMQLWRPILKDAQLDRRILFHAYNRYLAYKRGELRELPAIYEESIQYDSSPPTIRETRSHRAIRNQDLAELERALEQDPMDTQTLDYNGDAPIHCAASLGDVAALHVLIAAGGSIEQSDIRNNTALYKAACNNQVAFVNALVNLGCDFDREVVEDKHYFCFIPVCGHVSGFASPESIIIFQTLIALYPKIPRKAWEELPKCAKYSIARRKLDILLDILLEHKELFEDAPSTFWDLATSCIGAKNPKLLAYLVHHERAMKMSDLGKHFHSALQSAKISLQSKTLRILDRRCLWGVNVYDLSDSWRRSVYSGYWGLNFYDWGCLWGFSAKSLGERRQIASLFLSIRNRTLDGQVAGIRDFVSRVILPRANDDFAIQNLRRLQELARYERKDPLGSFQSDPYGQFWKTLSSLSESLGDILRAVEKSNWQNAEEATRDLLDRLEEIRSSDIWPYLIEHCHWRHNVRHEVWDYGSDDEDEVEDQIEEDGRENPWIGTEIRYVRL